MITEKQINNLAKLNPEDLCTIVQEISEILGIVNVDEYSQIMCKHKRTVYQDIKDMKIKYIEVGGTKFPCINMNL